VRELDATTSRFDRRASTYQDSALQQFLFGPAQETALQLAFELVPQARRILDLGCGTGQLLRRARPCYPTAGLVGVDPAGQMIEAAIAVTPAKLAVRYVRACAEHLPFTHDVFDLVFATLSLRHWTNPSAGIGEISRVLTPGGCWSLPTSFPASDAAAWPYQGCAVSTPPCRPISVPCWPPIALLSSVRPCFLVPAARRPGHRERYTRSVVRPTCAHERCGPASLDRSRRRQRRVGRARAHTDALWDG
jgi:ubiquinone/menaquinone biosynthesis C-methylase UbiE